MRICIKMAFGICIERLAAFATCATSMHCTCRITLTSSLNKVFGASSRCHLIELPVALCISICICICCQLYTLIFNIFTFCLADCVCEFILATFPFSHSVCSYDRLSHLDQPIDLLLASALLYSFCSSFRLS